MQGTNAKGYAGQRNFTLAISEALKVVCGTGAAYQELAHAVRTPSADNVIPSKSRTGCEAKTDRDRLILCPFCTEAQNALNTKVDGNSQREAPKVKAQSGLAVDVLEPNDDSIMLRKSDQQEMLFKLFLVIPKA